MTAPRFGLIGARRAHQGLGPFIARDIAAAGGNVVAVLGRTAGSAAEAAEAVEAAIGGAVPAAPKAMADPEAFFGLGLDAVCVLTPAGSHGAFVEMALGHGCHVLAEKPFLWAPETDWADRARDLEDRFAAAGLILAVNAQWPWTIPTLEEALGNPVQGAAKLSMGMQPASSGFQMIGDAAPHPLSVAQAIAPDLEAFSALSVERVEADELWIRGTLQGKTSSLDIEMHLDGRPLAPGSGPRGAWIAIDGTRVERCIRPRDYALFFRRGSALFDLPDPLTLRIADFLQRIQAATARPTEAPRAADRTISRRAGMLKAIVDAFQATA